MFLRLATLLDLEAGDDLGEFGAEGFDGVPVLVVVGGEIEALGHELAMVVLQIVFDLITE